MSSFPYLLVLLLLPLVGSIAVAAMAGAPARTAKLTALAISLVEFVVAVALWFDYRNFLNSGGGGLGDAFAETVRVSWIGSFNISFALGTDGISLVLIAMTCFLVPIVLGASWEEKLPA